MIIDNIKTESWVEGAYRISTYARMLDVALIHQELTHSYWAEGIPLERVERSLENSLCFGAYEVSSHLQVGFARVVTDFATFAYVADVFVVEKHRKKGISKFLMKSILAHPELQGLRRICLGTRDAQKLYEPFGFKNPVEPKNWMEIKVPDIYRKAASTAKA